MTSPRSLSGGVERIDIQMSASTGPSSAPAVTAPQSSFASPPSLPPIPSHFSATSPPRPPSFAYPSAKRPRPTSTALTSPPAQSGYGISAPPTTQHSGGGYGSFGTSFGGAGVSGGGSLSTGGFSGGGVGGPSSPSQYAYNPPASAFTLSPTPIPSSSTPATAWPATSRDAPAPPASGPPLPPPSSSRSDRSPLGRLATDKIRGKIKRLRQDFIDQGREGEFDEEFVWSKERAKLAKRPPPPTFQPRGLEHSTALGTIRADLAQPRADLTEQQALSARNAPGPPPLERPAAPLPPGAPPLGGPEGSYIFDEIAAANEYVPTLGHWWAAEGERYVAMEDLKEQAVQGRASAAPLIFVLDQDLVVTPYSEEQFSFALAHGHRLIGRMNIGSAILPAYGSVPESSFDLVSEYFSIATDRSSRPATAVTPKIPTTQRQTNSDLTAHSVFHHYPGCLFLYGRTNNNVVRGLVQQVSDFVRGWPVVFDGNLIMASRRDGKFELPPPPPRSTTIILHRPSPAHRVNHAHTLCYRTGNRDEGYAYVGFEPSRFPQQQLVLDAASLGSAAVRPAIEGRAFARIRQMDQVAAAFFDLLEENEIKPEDEEGLGGRNMAALGEPRPERPFVANVAHDVRDQAGNVQRRDFVPTAIHPPQPPHYHPSVFTYLLGAFRTPPPSSPPPSSTPPPANRSTPPLIPPPDFASSVWAPNARTPSPARAQREERHLTLVSLSERALALAQQVAEAGDTQVQAAPQFTTLSALEAYYASPTSPSSPLIINADLFFPFLLYLENVSASSLSFTLDGEASSLWREYVAVRRNEDRADARLVNEHGVGIPNTDAVLPFTQDGEEGEKNGVKGRWKVVRAGRALVWSEPPFLHRPVELPENVTLSS